MIYEQYVMIHSMITMAVLHGVLMVMEPSFAGLISYLLVVIHLMPHGANLLVYTQYFISLNVLLVSSS